MSLFWGKVCGNGIPGNVAVKKLLLFLSKKVNCLEVKKLFILVLLLILTKDCAFYIRCRVKEMTHITDSYIYNSELRSI